MRPTEKRGRGGRGVGGEGCAANLIFKCKQIYIVAKAPPTDVIPLPADARSPRRGRMERTGFARCSKRVIAPACRIFFSIIEGRREGSLSRWLLILPLLRLFRRSFFPHAGRLFTAASAPPTVIVGTAIRDARKYGNCASNASPNWEREREIFA